MCVRGSQRVLGDVYAFAICECGSNWYSLRFIIDDAIDFFRMFDHLYYSKNLRNYYLFCYELFYHS